MVRGPRTALPRRTAARTEKLQSPRLPPRHRGLRPKASTKYMIFRLFSFPTFLFTILAFPASSRGKGVIPASGVYICSAFRDHYAIYYSQDWNFCTIELLPFACFKGGRETGKPQASSQGQNSRSYWWCMYTIWSGAASFEPSAAWRGVGKEPSAPLLSAF